VRQLALFRENYTVLRVVVIKQVNTDTKMVIMSSDTASVRTLESTKIYGRFLNNFDMKKMDIRAIAALKERCGNRSERFPRDAPATAGPDHREGHPFH
jgi:hypothetical protein